MKAYFNAESAPLDADPKGHFLQACEQLRSILLKPDIKAPPADFATVRKFLLLNFGSGDGPNAAQLKARKAGMFWKVRIARGEIGTAQDDWRLGSEYVRLFYGNVIRAVENSDRSSMIKVLSAFREPWRQYGLINCFEAAIAIYFFDPEVILECSKDKLDLL